MNINFVIYIYEVQKRRKAELHFKEDRTNNVDQLRLLKKTLQSRLYHVLAMSKRIGGKLKN